ncbi:winged helix-turn-helix domain-containing protein [Streptomyces sp. NBC_00859]|uniref:winged helix-turn-helix domain-containing protein n=1 Tax=Streptomyces sp. NBC_00859 TaxID=2903682 RepID=UPI00386EF585|nr:winged helix-turn-helix domain-containing protein [Streptomyces sp. NBC_00859]
MPAGTFTANGSIRTGWHTVSGRPPTDPAVTVEPISRGRWVLAAQGYVPVSVRQTSSEVHLVFAPSPGPDAVPEPVAGTAAPPDTSADPVQVDHAARTVHVAGRQLELPRLEFDLLAYFISRPRHVHARHQLIAALWPDSSGGERTVDVHVARLRRRLGPQYRKAIATVVGVGYKYVPALACP